MPVAVKLHPYFSSIAEMAHRLDAAGADGLVLFNRFLQPDIDPETLTVTCLVRAVDPRRGAAAAGLDRAARRAGAGVARRHHRRRRRRRRGEVPAGRGRCRDDGVGAAAARAGVRTSAARRTDRAGCRARDSQTLTDGARAAVGPRDRGRGGLGAGRLCQRAGVGQPRPRPLVTCAGGPTPASRDVRAAGRDARAPAGHRRVVHRG